MLFRISNSNDEDNIKKLRSEVYVDELQQYTSSPGGGNEGTYIVATDDEDTLCGFIYVRYGSPYEWQRHIKKNHPLDCDEFEIGRLTVRNTLRNSGIAHGLMHAAKQFCMTRYFSDTFCLLARSELVKVYESIGMYRVSDDYTCTCGGGVSYILMRGDAHTRTKIPDPEWKLDLTVPCTHGGTVMNEMNDISAGTTGYKVVADVLDAWFPPSPRVSKKLVKHIDFFIRSSPSTNCNQLIDAIRTHRNISPNRSIVVGSGSSDLIYRCLTSWVNTKTRVLLLKPTYSEYPHIFKKVIGCVHVTEVNTLPDDLSSYDFACIVNPNSPTGTWIDLETVVATHPSVTFWVDETYIDFADKKPMESLEYDNLYVCKSMSKSYALSGARVAYVTGPVHDYRMDRVFLRTPPWVVSFPAQVAAIEALSDIDYYKNIWEKTREMREDIVKSHPDMFENTCCNFYNCPSGGDELYTKLLSRGVYTRKIDGGGLRIAVRSPLENEKILRAIFE